MIPNKIVSIFIAVFLALGSVYIVVLSWNAYKAHNYIGVSPKQSHTIFIVGEGRVTGVIPDIAKIQLGYSVEKKTVAEAQKDNSDKMNSVINKLKKDLKIDTKDIKTANYNITPQYDWNNGKQTLRGYSVNQDANVKVRDLNKISKILELAGTEGLNQIGNLSFEIDNPEKLKQQAREDALKQAKEKAETLAKIAGVNLGKVVSFSESDNTVNSAPIRVYSQMEKAMDSSMAGGASPSIESGSSDIVVNATVEYEIL